MIRSTGPLAALDEAVVEWSDAGEPRSRQYADCYFSSSAHGSEEKEHVFVAGSQLHTRLREHPRDSFVVGELGFGSGLNFLSTWQAILTHAHPETRLHYWSLDLHPLRRADLELTLQRFPGLALESAELLAAYPPPIQGVHRRIFAGGRVVLDLIWADAADAMAELSSLDQPLIDSWYLDGFAPARNEGMWTDALYQHMAASSHRGARIATYSAARNVRLGLAKAGFSVTKTLGAGLKRDNLQGYLSVAEPRAEQAASRLTPWDIPNSQPPPTDNTILVFGAGLAGAQVAAALARRGKQVQVVDTAKLAGLASGNPQGVLFTRLSHQRSNLTDFSILAFLFARDLYRQMFQREQLRPAIDGDLNGCFQAAPEQAAHLSLHSALAGLPELASITSAARASELLGTKVLTDGLWQPGSGWLSPPAVCAALLDSPNIRLLQDCGSLQLHRSAVGAWEARDDTGKPVATAGTAIIATGTHCRDFSQCQELPLKVVRGQTTQIPAPATGRLQHAYCHRGYIAPAIDGEHCIGASFLPDDEDQRLRVNEHSANLRALTAALPEWSTHLEQLDVNALRGKAASRCVTPDYLPMAGPVPDAPAFKDRFAVLGLDARRCIPERGDYLPNLYLSSGYGSRGLSYAALGAEIIASQICGEPPPVSRELQRASSPARFLIRGIIRGTVRGQT
ncbi:MAG: bifunctional tRNA (5-methylaminomethyl-2-thiouridine)(34)-methyltransferase MnmD/FAD-dependent 5-carboxymethylaminomethyl-2-thiouridine(34) oxidoreductase MnmC [Congregibacter sp.]